MDLLMSIHILGLSLTFSCYIISRLATINPETLGIVAKLMTSSHLAS